MIYIVYKTTNIINPKTYVGVHKTSNIDDGYLGSGLILKKAISKYGRENFKRDVLAIFDNPKDMFDLESTIVTEDFVLSPNTYNAKLGGSGGWDAANGGGYNVGNTQSHIDKINRDPTYKKEFYDRTRATIRAQYEAGRVGNFLGRNHSDETKRKIGEANSLRQQGENNNQYGTCWIHNLALKQSKRIKKENKSDWIQDGWVSGRKIKW